MHRFLPSHFPLRAWVMALALLQGIAVTAQVEVAGTVIDDDDEPLFGVNIIVPGADGVGTVTDLDGLYSLTVPAGYDSLTFSYIGYDAQTVALDGRSVVDVTMGADQGLLEEIVVVGYGTVAKRDLAGSVDQITEKRIENLPVTSLDQALAGQVQGVQFRQGSGQPGSGAEILVRGIGSLTGDGNAPLIVIDGVPYGNYNAQTNNFLNLVNPNDIASITVARDAAEKAIYGSRASAGLILITTKRGRAGQAPKISFNAYAGIQTVPEYERFPVLNATELATFLRERVEDDAIVRGREVVIPDELQDPSSYGEGTNWFDEITQAAPMNNADLSVRGGSENARYLVSFGYTNQEGIVLQSEFERYSARINLDFDVTPWLTIAANIAPTWTNTRNGNTESGTGGFSAYDATTLSRWADPTAPVRDEDGELTRVTRGSLVSFWHANPLFRLENDFNERENRQILASIRGSAQLGGGFSLSSSIAGNLRFSNIREFRSGFVVPDSRLQPEPVYYPGNSRSAAGRAEEQRLVWETQLGFDRDINDDGEHVVDAFVGYSTELFKQNFLNISGNQLIDENFTLFNSGNIQQADPNAPQLGTQIFFNGNENIIERALISYLGRARYTLKDRYTATFTLRSDGSSNFGDGNRFALFPAGSLAWRASDESWFPKGVVSNLRLEGSAGLSGSNTVRDYRYQGPVGGGGAYVLSGVNVRGRAINEIPNAELGWEETEQVDLGIQLGLFRDRLNFKSSVYSQRTTGLLFNTPIPNISGFGAVFANVGELQNRGIELGINGSPVIRDKFIWNVDANLSVNRNEVIQLGPGDDPTIRTTPTGQGTRISWTVVGDQIAQYYGLQMTGIFTQAEIDDPDVAKYPGAAEGSPKFVDGNGDGVLQRGVGDESDFVKIGDPWADFTFGLNTNLTYGDFSLQVLTLGEVGSQIFDLQREIIFNTEGQFNPGAGPVRAVFNNDVNVLERWRPGDADFGIRPPTTTEGAASNTFRTRSSANVLDASYWKINSLKLTYNLTPLSTRLDWLSSGSVYFAVQNVAVFSAIKGNPQIQRSGAGSSVERNIRYGAYPTARTFTLGANITL